MSALGSGWGLGLGWVECFRLSGATYRDAAAAVSAECLLSDAESKIN